MAGQQVRIQHTSMQFSDNGDQHRHDAKSIFDRAEHQGVWACTGTEAGNTNGNHDLRTALSREAQAHQFGIYLSGFGEWVALNKRLLQDFDHGMAGPFIMGTHGLTASQGAHSPRGIAWMSGITRPKDRLSHIGRLTFGAAHYLTDRSEQATNMTNKPLTKGIADWGHEHGQGNNVVFLGADVNTNDRAADVFMGQPFTTIADELGKWPATHGRRAIDVVASYNHDRRVKAKSYQVLDDNDMYLAGDHYALDAVYELSMAK
jgi:hypothetical protein